MGLESHCVEYGGNPYFPDELHGKQLHGLGQKSLLMAVQLIKGGAAEATVQS